MKALVIAIVALVIICLVGQRVDGANGVAGSRQLPGYVDIITDQATGCQYLVAGGGGLTPRLDQGGLRAMGCRG